MARRRYQDNGSWQEYDAEGELVNRSGNWGTAGYDPMGDNVTIGGQEYSRIGMPWGNDGPLVGQTFQGRPYSDFTLSDPTYGMLARTDAVRDAARHNKTDFFDYLPGLMMAAFGPAGLTGMHAAAVGAPSLMSSLGQATGLFDGGAGGVPDGGSGWEPTEGGAGPEYDLTSEYNPWVEAAESASGTYGTPEAVASGVSNSVNGLWPALAGPAANALGNVGDPTIDANAPTVDAGLGGGGGGSAVPPGLLASIAQTLGMSVGDLAKLIGAGAGAATSYFTGQRNKDIAREMIDLGAPERARFRSMTPGSFATEMNPVLEQLANARARQWSQQVGNPANSPQAMIATDQDMASTLFGAYNQERGMLANTGWGLASPLTGYRSLSDAGTRQAEGIGGAVGSVLDTIAGTPKRDGAADLADLIRNNPGLFGIRSA